MSSSGKSGSCDRATSSFFRNVHSFGIFMAAVPGCTHTGDEGKRKRHTLSVQRCYRKAYPTARRRHDRICPIPVLYIGAG